VSVYRLAIRYVSKTTLVCAIPYNSARSSYTSIADTGKKSFAIYLIQDDEESISLDMRVEIQVMGFIRPPDQLTNQKSTGKINFGEVQAEAAVLSVIKDIEIAEAFLDRPAWRRSRILMQTHEYLCSDGLTNYHCTERESECRMIKSERRL